MSRVLESTRRLIPTTAIRRYFRRYRQRQHVRPWALATPILVLLVALPMLHPLRHPDPRQMSRDEAARLATVAALVEKHTLAITPSTLFDAEHLSERVVHIDKRIYSDQPPVLAVLLAPFYAILRGMHLTFENSPVLVPYLLTVFAGALPVAGCAGLVYRMGRMLEIPRIWRAALAATVVFATGLIAFATTINSYAPAATLVLGACACLVHVALSQHPHRQGGWLIFAGLCAGFAAVIEPTTLAILIGLPAVIWMMRWGRTLRVAGVLFYILGAVGPLLLHTRLVVPVTGDLRPPAWHQELTAPPDLEDVPPGVFDTTFNVLHQVIRRLFGLHGILMHYPVLVVGAIGIFLVLPKHWPGTTKAMAVVTIAAVVVAILVGPSSEGEEMYGPWWFMGIAPLLGFWIGAFIRKRHEPVTWGIVAVLLAFSLIVSVIGTKDCARRGGVDGYSPVAVFHK